EILGERSGFNETYYHDGEFIGYQTRTSTDLAQYDGGSDTLAFGSGIAASDLSFQLSGSDLIVGVKDPANPTATFAQLTDKITLQGWTNPFNRIETLQVGGVNRTLKVGTAGADALTGTAGNDWLAGLAGNDT